MNPAEEQLSCQELVELVTDYVEGALPEETRARFEAHVGLCDGCRVYLEQMRQTIQATGKLTEAAIDPTARDELLKVFRDWKSS